MLMSTWITGIDTYATYTIPAIKWRVVSERIDTVILILGPLGHSSLSRL